MLTLSQYLLTVREERKRKKIKIEQISNDLGYSKTTISNALNGVTFSVRTLGEIIDYINCFYEKKER